MEKSTLEKYYKIYRNGLLDDVLPFWMKHAIDREDGGYIFCLDRDGTVLDTDKSVWIHCRFVWLLSTLYNTVEKRAEWLELARHGIDFILKHCFDDDGRMYFTVTKDGRPLRKRRYLFSELFGLMAFSSYATASGDDEIADRAAKLFRLVKKYLRTPGLLEPKVYTDTREMKGLSIPMMQICTGDELRAVVPEADCREWIDEALDGIEKHHVNDDYRCVLESVGLNGEFFDHFDGRLITPGHGIEAGWFILNEALKRGGDERLVKLGCKVVDYCWEVGWDEEFGGMIYFRDAKGLPVTEYWHDMKFWWPQNEAIIASLLAWHITGDEKYAKMHELAHDWAYKHFPDEEYGEWYGYLHRDGRVSNTIKGNMWKGPFHLPRMLWYCMGVLEKAIAEVG